MKPLITLSCLCLTVLMLPSPCPAGLKAGAAIVDVTPTQYPVLVNGGMTSRTAEQATSPINARAIVLDDGETQIGIVVVDSCMISRPVLDEAKQQAEQQVGLAMDHILISATHTHTAPSAMGALGTDAEVEYLPVLRNGIVDALKQAQANLQPARVGWAVTPAPQFTAVRRWIRRPDRLDIDPFGNKTVRANMHAASNPDNVVGESGPEDPDLSLIALQSTDGRPIAVLANFSMHYFSGVQPLNADYFGLFCKHLAKQIDDGAEESNCVAIMSHGCSGDIWRRDYTKTGDEQLAHTDVDAFSKDLAQVAHQAWESIEYTDAADLAMAEARFELHYRVPDVQRLEWAHKVVAEMGDRLPKTKPEIYAREQIILHERQSTEVVVQALRIGDIGIATTPNETYALTGMKIKRHSPLEKTMVIELANGGDGYIPPPEQHLLGGYNTWAARSAGLEVQAEPRITETAIALLEQVADRPRRDPRQSTGPAASALLAAKPMAYWRLGEMSGPWANDETNNGHDALYEPRIAYFLAGPKSEAFCLDGDVNRAAHFAGDRLRVRIPQLGDRYSVALWFWNGMPNEAERTGWMFSRGRAHDRMARGDHLGLGGKDAAQGKLVFASVDESGSPQTTHGETLIERWTWNHAVLVRDGRQVRVYLNGSPQPEIEVTCDGSKLARINELFFGGRCDRQGSWEGRLDEIALFDRPLSAEEVERLSTAE